MLLLTKGDPLFSREIVHPLCVLSFHNHAANIIQSPSMANTNEMKNIVNDGKGVALEPDFFDVGAAPGEAVPPLIAAGTEYPTPGVKMTVDAGRVCGGGV